MKPILGLLFPGAPAVGIAQEWLARVFAADKDMLRSDTSPPLSGDSPARTHASQRQHTHASRFQGCMGAQGHT